MVATEAVWPAKPTRCNFLALPTLDIEDEKEEDGKKGESKDILNTNSIFWSSTVQRKNIH